jgi:4-hydroxybenzoate polyprenyltransferase/phosphoserine phosphatase
MNFINSTTSPSYEIERHPRESGSEAPLFVDLDGTLVKSDLLIESLLALVKREPMACLSVIGWLRRGRGHLKSKLAEKVDINAKTLPYHGKFLDYLCAEAARGRPLYLATASNQKLADKIANHLGIFRGVLASDDETNLKGHKKLLHIQKVSGGGQFDYAGNARADIDIWRHARRAVLVNPQPRVESAARKIGNVSAVFDDRQKRFFAYVKALRLHQWLKNLLLFVPMLTAHAWRLEVLVQACVAAVAFGLAASSVYLLNDMLDLESDRSHPRKCTRPFAASAVPLLHGVALIVILILASLALGAVLSNRFLAVVGLYLALSTAYSVYLKQYVLIDVIVLALLYTLRVIAGAVAIEVVMSFWLLAFSMFFFMSLALVKRCSELVSLMQVGTLRAGGRDYAASDLAHLTIMGTANGYISILVLALFINSQDITVRYSNPQALWLLCPLMLYWISRVWLKTGRGEMRDDPVVFALLDRASRYVVAGLIIVVLLAI